MRNSVAGSPSPITRVQNGITCISPRAPALETANLRKLLSTWIRPSTRLTSSPERLLSYQIVWSSSMRSWAPGIFFFSRSLMSPSQRRCASRASVLANSGTGGALLWMAELSADRTESISGSSICAPASARRGIVSANAPAVAPPRHSRRDMRSVMQRVASG